MRLSLRSCYRAAKLPDLPGRKTPFSWSSFRLTANSSPGSHSHRLHSLRTILWFFQPARSLSPDCNGAYQRSSPRFTPRMAACSNAFHFLRIRQSMKLLGGEISDIPRRLPFLGTAPFLRADCASETTEMPTSCGALLRRKSM